MRRRFLITLALAHTLIYSVAQQTFRGIVTDASGAALEAAIVQLVRTSDSISIAYTLTDAKGAFGIATRIPADSLTLSVSILGYKTHNQSIQAEHSTIRMEEEVFSLREVEIRPGRVWSKSDTINYDVAQFISAKDETIKDVIKKLPGLDVSEAGKISYNGRDISSFYIEGMDLAGGQYGRITGNLEAKAVESVQVLENHQPLRILKDKIKTENVALNLKLRSDFRDKWMVMLQAGAGIPHPLWEASAGAFQLGRRSQSAYNYKTTNAGRDITDEQIIFLGNSGGMMPETPPPSFLSQPSISAPLKKERLLFNNMHTLSANRLYRIGETSRLRFDAGLAHDERRQERGSSSVYFQASDTVVIAEQSDLRLRSDKADINIDFEDNAPAKYITDKFKASISREESFASYRSVNQRINTPSLAIRNELSALWNHRRYTLEARSVIRYSAFPSELLIDGSIRERLAANTLYTAHSFSLLKKSGAWTQKYTGGIDGQVSDIANAYTPYILPSFQWNKSIWSMTLNIPLTYTAIPMQGFARTAASPAMSIQCKPHYAWRIGASAAFRESYGSLSDLSRSYFSDYRTIIRNSGDPRIERTQSYSFYTEYRRAVHEFFSSLSISRRLTASNYIIEETFEQELRTLSALSHPRTGEGWNIQGAISKGFYDYGIKLSLNCLLVEGRSEQISRGQRLPYLSRNMQYEPKISWTPFRRLEASWQAGISYGGAKVGQSDLNPLCNIVQTLRLAYEYGGIEYNLSADHYYNDLSADQSVNAFLSDIGIRLRPGKWQIEVTLSNIFDKRQYGYAQYSSNQMYTSWINIRGRELMLSARHRF